MPKYDCIFRRVRRKSKYVVVQSIELSPKQLISVAPIVDKPEGTTL